MPIAQENRSMSMLHILFVGDARLVRSVRVLLSQLLELASLSIGRRGGRGVGFSQSRLRSLQLSTNT